MSKLYGKIMKRIQFCRSVVLTAVGLLIGSVGAMSFPPYEVFPYIGEDGDSPKVNYMKVCEPGVSGEANASFVVLGISFPRTFQAIDGGFDGELVIPSYIDGLPVRKINEAAFIECVKLRSVRIPATVREIGDRAFTDCLSLTNVTIESGVSRVGDGAFSNCVSLASIRFPKTLSYLGLGCFHGCLALRDVYFDGNAPRLKLQSVYDRSAMGEAIYRWSGYNARFKVHINRNTSGWISPYLKGVPEKWPVDLGYMQAHETVSEEGDGPAEAGYAVVFDAAAGSGSMPDVVCERNLTYRLPLNRFIGPEGKRFAGWRCDVTGRRYDDGQLIFNLSATPGAVVTMTAVWE